MALLDSIIPEEQPRWNKLGNTDTLVQLHSKFWGVNMQDEERKWRATQPEHDMTLDLEETAEENEEDEIGSGCYILTLGIPGLGSSPLWVRKESIRMYNFCEEYLKFLRGNGKTPSVIVTGQLGIGECLASLSHRD